MGTTQFFLSSETDSHPMIRGWKKPAFASTIWGSIQLLADTLTLRQQWPL